MRKFLLLVAFLFATATAFARETETTYYIIGSNVNGYSWALAAPDAAFESKGGGIYEWNGQVLGSGFKINDGTWSSENVNWGSNGKGIVLGEAYHYGTAYAGNIYISGYTEVANPKVVLDINNGTITLNGDLRDAQSWYCIGDFNKWKIGDESTKMTEISKKIFEVTINIPAGKETGFLKIASEGFNKQYGNDYEAGYYISPSSTNIPIKEVDAEGAIPYELEAGDYIVTFDLNKLTLQVVPKFNTQPEYYLIGSNVNGNSWQLKADDAKFTKLEENIYEWQGIELGSGFKINNGTWGDINIGAPWDNNTGDWCPLILNTPYAYTNSEVSGFIKFEHASTLHSPVVRLDMNSKTITVTGETKNEEETTNSTCLETEETPMYFNLQGERIAHPTNGMYIRVIKGKAYKVVM